MASTRPWFPVLLVDPEDSNAVSTLCHKVLLGLYANIAIFVAPTVAELLFTTELGILDAFILAAIKNESQVEPRNAQSRKMYRFLKKLVKYADPICDGNIEKIGLSGFPSNHQPSRLPTPETSGIVRIVKGKMVNTYKVYLLRKSTKTNVEPDPATHLKGVLYTVELTITPAVADSWKIVCLPAPRTKLIIDASKTFPGKLNYVRVFGSNSAGAGQPCDFKTFTPDALP